MKRNRSVRTIPVDNLKHPLPDTNYFGEQIPQKSPDSDESFDAFLSNFLSSNNASSSSSLSWGTDNKNESPQLVKQELERMDKVLTGQEPIPLNYDREEYLEWMDFFPSLCVFGRKASICDKTFRNLESVLQISRLPKRQSSSRSLITSHLSASKWLKDDEINCNLLPFIAGVKGEKVGMTKGILKNSLILPPIRSVSATPQWPTKSLSALSNKYCKKAPRGGAL